MNLNLNNLLAGVHALLPAAEAIVTALNPAAGAALTGIDKIANEIETGIPAVEAYLASLKAAKAGFTQEQWDALRAGKQADDDAILALQPQAT